MNRIRLLLLILILCLIAAGLWLDAGRFLSLQFLQARFTEIETVVGANYPAASALFFLLYAGLASLSVPGAALVLTLAGGALFGVVWGTVLVSFASTIGATLGCLLSRFVLREFVEKRFPYAANRVNEGIRHDGGYYLFALRLVPVFPFFIINLVMGLTRLPLRTFFWISQVGMLPGTVLFVNAGTQLSTIHDASDVLSPRVAGSLALLGVFPLVARKAADALLAWHRTRL